MATAGDLVYKLDESNTNSTEPALWTGVSFTAVAGAIVMGLELLLPNMDEGLKKAILGVLVVILPLIVGFVTRGKVWSPNSVNKVVSQSVTNAMRESNAQIKDVPLPRRNPTPKPEDFPPSLGNKDF